MRDEALTSLLNSRIRSYLMPKTSHCFASLAGKSGVGVLFEHFSWIYPCKSSDVEGYFRTKLTWQG
jgi:hypothetical protein